MDDYTREYIHTLTIGNVQAKNNIILAPLAGITDRAFRTICMEHGAGMCYTEMISAKGVHYKGKGSIELAESGPLEAPCGVQIFGSEPELMAEAAKIFEDRGAVLIDINMGCPMRKVTSNGEGSALMNNPALINKIVSAVSSSVTVPVTVKMRRGYSPDNESAVECALAAEAGGAKAVTVHGRFREEYYSGTCCHEIIRKVKCALHIPVIASGDVTDRASAKIMFDDTGCDAIMIGRGAMGNPWVFGDILRGEDRPSIRELRDTMFEHINLLVSYKEEEYAIPEMRKHVGWYLKGLRGSARIRESVCKAATRKQLEDELNEYFDILMQE